MKGMRPVVMFVMLGVGFGVSAPDFAASQPHPPLPGRPVIAPRPPGPARRPPVVVPESPAIAPRVRAVKKRRSPVVINPGWPLKRPPRPVVVQPPRVVAPRVRVVPRVYLPPVVFGGTVVVERHGHRRDYGYSRDSLVWQDGETLYREDEWTEFTLDCNTRGTRLWFEITEGRVQMDWAEVVFENGEVQVVEFPERSIGRGIYELLDFRHGRRVEYVRLVAQATTREASLTLWLER